MEDSDQYSNHFPNIDIEHEAPKYLASGVYNGELGDGMLMALSNVVKMYIFNFTSVVNMPLLVVTPSEDVITQNPITAAYNQYGTGHYSSLSPKSIPPTYENKVDPESIQSSEVKTEKPQGS